MSKPTPLPSKIPEELSSFIDLFPGNQLFVGISPEERAFPFTGTLAHNYETLVNREKFKWNTYFTVNETDGSGYRKKENVIKIRAIFLDDDNVREKPRTDFLLLPSIIVETSPGKFHYYWLTETLDFEEWERVMEGLIKLYNGDENAKDLCRILRLPTFKNYKYEKPFVSKVVYISGKVYTWDEIKAKYPPVEKRAPEILESSDHFSVIEQQNIFWSAESINLPMTKLIMHYAWRGYSTDSIEAHIADLFKHIPPESYAANSQRYENSRAQITKNIKYAKEKVRKHRAPVQKLHNISEYKVPQSLEFDWHELKSNPITNDCIPDVLINAAEEVGKWTGVGRDPAILSAIFLTSSLLSKNVLIHIIGDDLTTHAQCGAVIVMDTGARKSSIYEQMNKPFFEFEDQLVKEWEEIRYENEARINIYEKQIKDMEKELLKKGTTDEEQEIKIKEIGRKRKEINDLQVKRPWLRTADVTEEKLVRKLDENDGTIAVISDDARQVIKNLKGRYNKDSSGESVYINALTGSDIIYERVGLENFIHIKKPALNALLFVQPDAALELKNADMYVPSGLAARLPIYFYPTDGVDIFRNTELNTLDATVMNAYYSTLQTLCVRRFKNPLHIDLSKNGIERCRQMYKELADLLEGEWEGQYDKINKIVTTTIIYATCMAALDDIEFRLVYQKKDAANCRYTLGTKYLNMAFDFAKKIFSQSIITFDKLEAQKIPRMAKEVLEKIESMYNLNQLQEGFTNTSDFRNCFTESKRPFVHDCIDFLLLKDWLFVTQWDGESRKLNGGVKTTKVVNPGEIIYHLNVKGIAKLRSKLSKS